jgi:dTDP-4-dehydrorhamnose reductase
MTQNKRFTEMKVLVTGSNGQVGHCLVEQFSNKGIDLLALDREQLDITDPLAVSKTVRDYSPDIIINSAAYTAVDKAEKEIELSYLINRDGPKFLAQAANDVGAAILHISTDYVFSGERRGEYVESDNTRPLGVYGASKLAGEIEVQEFCSRYIILRTAWVFCEHGNNFVKTMLQLGAQRDSLSIVTDQFGGPTYAGDIASALINIAEQIVKRENIEFGIYHFSGLPYVSWYDFAEYIFNLAVDKQILSKKPRLVPLTTDQYPTLAKRPANSKLNTNKITQYFEIKASDWKKSLENLENYSCEG